MKQQQILVVLLGKLTLSISYLTTESLKERARGRGRLGVRNIIVLNTDSGILRSCMFGLAEGYQKPLSKRMTFVVAKVNNFYFCFPYASI